MGMGLNIEVVEGPYVCFYCGATFDSQPELDSHITTVHIAGIPDWLGKYWPVLVFGGIGLSLLGLFIFKKKKGK